MRLLEFAVAYLVARPSVLLRDDDRIAVLIFEFDSSYFGWLLTGGCRRDMSSLVRWIRHAIVVPHTIQFKPVDRAPVASPPVLRLESAIGEFPLFATFVWRAGRQRPEMMLDAT